MSNKLSISSKSATSFARKAFSAFASTPKPRTGKPDKQESHFRPRNQRA